MNPNSSIIRIKEGDRFGTLTILSFDGKSQNGHFKWLCKCDCGNTTSIFATNLRRGLSNSCFPCGRVKTGRAKSTHGQTTGRSPTKEYATWASIKRRCYNKADKSYFLYGERGITMCDRWLNSFENFYQDMGDKPSSRHSIDRINNNKGYGPDNCHWVLPEVQANNKRNNRFLTLGPVTLTYAQWERERPMVKAHTLMTRKKRGWSDADCLLKPVKRKTA